MTDESQDEPDHDPDPSADEEREAFEIVEGVAGKAKPVSPGRERRIKPRRRLPFFSRTEELSRATLKLRERQQNIDLKRLLARFAIGAVSAQLLFADVAFGYYVWKTIDLQKTVDSNVLIAWLSATVVEVIGIVLVIARNLFPAPRMRRPKTPAPDRR